MFGWDSIPKIRKVVVKAELTVGLCSFIQDDISTDLGGGSPSGSVPAVFARPRILPNPS
jgi:hypothetical protein